MCDVRTFAPSSAATIGAHETTGDISIQHFCAVHVVRHHGSHHVCDRCVMALKPAILSESEANAATAAAAAAAAAAATPRTTVANGN